MESWEDQAVILALRPHGENAAIISLLTEAQGRQAGYLHGARSASKRAVAEIGNVVDARWQSRVSENLGTLSLELAQSVAAQFLDEPLKLAALQSACALCDAALPEREGHPGLFHGLRALFEALQTEVWAQAYIIWEIALLRELGFALNLKDCAGGVDAGDLAYVSPKTGRAVSAAAGAPYKEKLLPLPGFLRPTGEDHGSEDILTGLDLTGYFLEHWVFVHHTKGVPEERLRLRERMGKF